MAATTTSRTSSNAASVPFSYAQAAKGKSAVPGSSVSKASSSGAITPAKDAQPTSTTAAAVMNWAEDAQANDPRSEKPSSTREPRTQHVKSSTVPSELTATALSSPEMGASTASTVTKDDDVSSVPNTSSDSTWENKSQASTSVDKSTEPSEKSSQKGKGKKREQPPAKPLQEAPVPVVNIWQQRAESRQKPVKTAAAASLPNGTLAKQVKEADNVDVKGRAASTESKPRGAEEEKGDVARQESRNETDADKNKKYVKGRPQEKEMREPANLFILPLDRDQESWPTMDAAIDEDRKKAQVKSEKTDKERKDSVGAKTGGKGQHWVKVPYVPSPIFNTPLPSTGARRGGRGAARGGAQSGGRAGFSANGPEKDTSSSASIPNGDQPRRGRLDTPIREASPRGKRTASSGSLATKDKPAQPNGEKLAKSAQTDVDSQSREPSILTETPSNVSGSGQRNIFPRQYPSNRSNKGRRGDWSGPDRRKDGDNYSPTKENGFSNERTSSTQMDAPEDGERRTSTYVEGQAPHQSKRGSNDRFGGYSSRERRGGGRGGRGGNFSNGHQFANGHISSTKQSSTYPGPMSPTAFNPEQTPYFPQARYRNGPRSQSVTTDSMYRMSGQYGGPQQIPPINTYMGGNGFDYPMMQHPMSAVPFGQYGMDHLALFSMVTTQLEYYFSLENLCKDMFLRKHMDSKGFVFLNVISGFRRIQQLTTDLELIKLVCYQSRTIEFRVGHDGKDRLRARENWQQWVLPMDERDPSAQNEGPEELYNPPIPHPHGFDPNGNPRYPDTSSAPGAYANEGSFPAVNGFHPGASQHPSAGPTENLPNGVGAEHVNDNVIPNGNPIDDSTKAVSDEPDSFSDEQVESLIVIVRKQDDFQIRNDAVDEPEGRVGSRATCTPNGAGSFSGIESEVQDRSRRSPSPFVPIPSMTCSQYWVKNNDAPVDVAPPGCFHESYAVLRSKALQQRQHSFSGICSYDMSVLYQFWSHFLVRNFNARMYDEFHLFALEDARNNLSTVGISNLIKFYRESILSGQNVVRHRVVRDFVDLVRLEDEPGGPAFQHLRTALHNDNMTAPNRIRLSDLLDDHLKALLD